MYLQEMDYNIGVENDPKTFLQAVSSKESSLWHKAMIEDMNLTVTNKV